MQATKLLPAGYRLHEDIDLTRNRSLLITLNLLSLVLLLIFGFLFLVAATYLRGALGGQQRIDLAFPNPLLTLLGALACVTVVILLHELVHGLFFWLFTGERPHFGLKLGYAYAAAPSWYLPRNQFMVVGLAPFLLLTLGGLLLLPTAPGGLVAPLLLAMTLNAAGAVGDFFVVGLLLLRPSHVLVRDRGDTFTIYGFEREQRDRAGSH